MPGGSEARGPRPCQICGEETTGTVYIKDPEGRYFHRACRDRARQSRAAGGTQASQPASDQRVEIPAARQKAKAAPRATTRGRAASEAPTPGEDVWTDESGPSRLGEFLGGGEDASSDSAPGRAAAGNGSTGGGLCPQCGAATPRGAVLCTHCGFHFKKGSAVETRVGGGGKSSSSSSSERRTAARAVGWPVAMVMATVCGVVAGAIGAAAWGLVAHQTGREFGFMALGVGALCGVGAGFGAQSRKGLASGLLAVVVSLLAIAGGKATFLALEIGESPGSSMIAAGGGALPDEQALVLQVDREALRRERAGETLQWPPGMSYERAFTLADFPPALVASIEREWNGLGADARQTRKASILRELGVVTLARGVAQERAAAGDTLNWSPGMSLEYAVLPEDFPVSVRTEAEARHDAMSPEQQAELLGPLLQAQGMLASLEGAVQEMASSYSGRSVVFDLIWGVLAISVAFSLGAGVGRS